MQFLRDRTEQIERSQRGRTLIRAAVATLIAGAEGDHPERVAMRIYPQDKSVPALITKAAVTTYSTSSDGSMWSLTRAEDFINLLMPTTAYATLFRAGLQFEWDRAGTVLIADPTSPTATVAFMPESGAIPVRQMNLTSPFFLSLTPKKLAAIAGFTREVTIRSTPSLETLVRITLADCIGQYLDSLLLDANAGTAVRPPGLRFGITNTAPSAVTIPSEAMLEDIGTLVGITSAVSGGSSIILVASIKQATVLALRKVTDNFLVVSSPALPDKTVMALASNCFASITDPVPQFTMTDQATLHFDTAPTDISGSPGTFASPVRSLWQTDTLALKVLMNLSWGLRSATGCAWMQNVLW